MAQFIAVMTRNVEQFAEADFTPLLGPEAERVRELYAEGTVRAAWGRGDVPGAVLLLECADVAAAEAALATLPLMAKGMLRRDLYPVGPYRGFAPQPK